jgi:hypothetical protein
MDKAFGFEYVFQDIPSLIEGFIGIINQSSLARISGVNESLMRQYVSGLKKPSRKITERIESGLKNMQKNCETLHLPDKRAAQNTTCLRALETNGTSKRKAVLRGK